MRDGGLRNFIRRRGEKRIRKRKEKVQTQELNYKNLPDRPKNFY